MDDFSRELFTENYLAAIAAADRHRACDIAGRDYELMMDVLVSVLTEVTDDVFPRDRWQTITAFERPAFSACAFRQTTKSQMEVELSIAPGQIRLSYGLRYAYQLPKMPDTFWAQLIDLVETFRATYEMTSWPMGFGATQWDKYLSKQRKSKVFAMISDFVLTTQIDTRSHPIGDFEFNFQRKPWKRLIPTLREIIMRGCALNYQLYRSAERWRQQVTKRALRRLEKEKRSG